MSTARLWFRSDGSATPEAEEDFANAYRVVRDAWISDVVNTVLAAGVLLLLWFVGTWVWFLTLTDVTRWFFWTCLVLVGLPSLWLVLWKMPSGSIRQARAARDHRQASLEDLRASMIEVALLDVDAYERALSRQQRRERLRTGVSVAARLVHIVATHTLDLDLLDGIDIEQ